MHSMDFYASTCRCVMMADPGDPESWADLYRLLPCLRQSLGCYVCFDILEDPMGPTDNVCKHTVCRKCVGGKMKLKPACSWCKDHWFFQPNPLQKILVECFQKLCLYILSSPIGKHILEASPDNVSNILKEGAEFHEHDMVNSDNPERDKKPVELFISEPGCSSKVDCEKNMSGNESKELDEDETNKKEVYKSYNTQKFAQKSEKVNGVARNRMGKRRNKHVPKTVVFFKRASENKKSKLSQALKKKAMKHSSIKKRTTSVSKNKSNLSKEQEDDDAPNDLEKMDYSEPILKRVKHELPPPELKPLTSCKCGKSGNSNQLTCLGQRCQCYSMKLPCIGCKCKGCRNPKKGPDSSSYPTSGIYGSSYLRSGTKALQENICVNM